MRCVAAVLVSILIGCTTVTPSPTHAEEKLAEGPQLAWLDRAVDPCTDFYRFACGTWIQRTRIPEDTGTWAPVDWLQEQSLARMRQILEADANGSGDPADPYAQKLGDYYAACMDEPTIAATADGELQTALKIVDDAKAAPTFEAVIAQLHRRQVPALFLLTSTQDSRDATQVIADLDQGGLGLPDRDLYLTDDPPSRAVQKAYQETMTALLGLAAGSDLDALAHVPAEVTAVYAFERQLASASQDTTFRQDPSHTYHPVSVEELTRTAPGFNWVDYLGGVGLPKLGSLNVQAPDFLQRVGELVQKTPQATLRAYLRWKIVADAAPRLSRPFVDQSFRLTAALTGQKELEPRWKRCTWSTNAALGMALGASFGRQFFGAANKVQARAMLQHVGEVMKGELTTLPWLDAPTRAAAVAKLDKIVAKVGYPDEVLNYDGMAVARGSYLANTYAATQWLVARDLTKIGKPLNRAEWNITPPTANALYNSSLNEMVFPAGILQPPYFSGAAPPDLNFGSIGWMMGHELTHAFDEDGAQFDGDGNLRNWFSPASLASFKSRGQCVVDQFDSYSAVGELRVNGKLTEGENIADLGGVRLALLAARATRAGKPEASVEGFTPDQLVFLGYAQTRCNLIRPETQRAFAATDPHAPPEWRVNGTLANITEFAEAFGCPAGAKMVRPPAERCQVW